MCSINFSIFLLLLYYIFIIIIIVRMRKINDDDYGDKYTIPPTIITT